MTLSCTTELTALPSERQIGGYRVLAPLGRGGTAGVYLAEDEVTGERVALKLLAPWLCHDAELARRLLEERAVSEGVRHPGLLDVRRADRSADGAPYLVMEHLEGESVEALADRGGLGARSSRSSRSSPRSRRRSARCTPPGSCTATSSRPTCSCWAGRRRAPGRGSS